MLSAIITIVLVLVALVAVYVLYMSRKHGSLKKYGFESDKIRPVMGTMKFESFLNQIVKQYQKFKDKKVYASYGPGMASVVVTDLEMIRDILTKKFNSFPDRRKSPKLGKSMDYMLTLMRGDHWKHVRSTLSPTFSSGKVKRISKLVEKTSQTLVANLTKKMERNEPVELKMAISSFSMDVIANSGFGIHLDSVNDPQNPFFTAAKKMMAGMNKSMMVFGFFPFMIPILNFFGYHLFCSESLDFFSSFVDKAMEERKSEGENSKRHDFLQLIVDAENENQAAHEDNEKNENGEIKTKYHGLTRNEIQGSALIFILASYDTIGIALSFAIFLLAMHPEILKKVQNEIDEKLGSDPPNHDNVANLTYLDMCLQEALRLYPPGFVLERLCVEDTEIQGVTFPKDNTVQIPVYAIHRDPELWEDPDEFIPERFSPEQKQSRNQYSYLPFGHGPRNCIGMRLAQLEVKIGIAAVLQKLTPVACDKTVFPIVLSSMRMEAKDGLWLKMEKRQKS